MRDFILRGAVACGVFTMLLTELFSPFHLLRRGPLACAWLAAAVWAGAWVWMRRPRFSRPVAGAWEAGLAAAIGAIAVPVGLTAWLSAPNSYDALAYHLPRVVYWAQSGSVAFFATSYLNQLSQPPLDEYFMLHGYVLSGGDRFANLVAWGAFAGCIVAVSAATAALGAGRRAQALAAFFCATLPSAILHASGAKNEPLLAFWLVCVVYFGLRENLPLMGLSFGLALATKSTAYLFAPPLIAACLPWWKLAGKRPRLPVLGLWLALGALALNGPHYARNLQFSGSPLGFDAPFGTGGTYRWANAHPDWKATVSNIGRHLSDQLGERSERWNAAVYGAVTGLHRRLGLDASDPATTWAGVPFRPPSNTAHETSANNRWHLALLAAAVLAMAWRRKALPWIVYAASLLAGFLLFCFYLKWEFGGARFLLPLFVLASPLAGNFLGSLRPAILALPVCLFLFSGARLPALKNWMRPLVGPGSVWTSPREENYFLEIAALHNREWYLEAVDRTARSGCTTVAVDTFNDQAEYPFQALLLDRNPAVRFLHSGVANASARYDTPRPVRPCAALCMSCAIHPENAGRYADLGPPLTLGGFVLFLAPR